MRTIHVMVGASGSGKSTFVSQNSKHGDLIVESDFIRETNGLDYSKEDSKIVFEHAENDVESYIVNGDDGDLWFDATNLNRNQRRVKFNKWTDMAWDTGLPVIIEIHFMFASIYTLLHHNELREDSVTVQYLWNNWLPDIPRVGVDCHSFTFEGADDMISEVGLLKVLMNYTENNPYHSESLNSHITDVAMGCIKQGLPFDIGYYHDAGKPWTIHTDNNGITHNIGHEKLGAMFYLASIINDHIINNKFDWTHNTKEQDGAEIIYQHMNAVNNDGKLGKKNIKKNKLEKLVRRIELFAEIDKGAAKRK